MAYVIGVDGGGTSTRCVVADLDGRIIARASAGGSNHRSSPDPAGHLVTALSGATAELDASQVLGGALCLAGAGGAGIVRAREMAAVAWGDAGLAGTPTVLPDIVACYASATAELRGAVLIAGTGAVAARIDQWAITRRCDGYGWLIGDHGSGVWIGREAVSRGLAAVDRRGPDSALAVEIPAALDIDADLPVDMLTQAIVATVYESDPAALGQLSPIVDKLARAGDPVALDIVREAAEHLLRTADGVRDKDAPMVLGGGLLTADTMVAELVRSGLSGQVFTIAGDSAAGAAAIALHYTGKHTARKHQRLISS